MRSFVADLPVCRDVSESGPSVARVAGLKAAEAVLRLEKTRSPEMRGVMKGCTTGVESRRDEERASKGRGAEEEQRNGRSS
jgi:hypothetical protein